MTLGAKRRNLLVFTSTLERTGSEIVLFNFLMFSGIERDFDVHVITLKNGFLKKELSQKFDVSCYDTFYEEQKKLTNRVVHKFRREKSYKTIFLDKVVKSFELDVVFVNGFNVSSGFFIDYLKSKSFPPQQIVLYSHEMSVALTSANRDFCLSVQSAVGRIYSCSEASAGMMKTLFKIEPVVIYPGINSVLIEKVLSENQLSKSSWGISESQPLWIMSGYSDQNKDPVFFVNLFEELQRRGTSVFFAWIGADETSGFTHYCKSLIDERGLTNIRFFPNLPPEKYYPLLRLMDGLVLTSTVDSFPTVMLEAAFLGKFIVSYNSGGVAEFLSANQLDCLENKSIKSYADAIERCLERHPPEYNMKNFIVPDAARRWADQLLGDFGL